MQKLRKFLWKKPGYDKPLADMTYNPETKEFLISLHRDIPDDVTAGCFDVYRFFRHIDNLNAEQSLIFVQDRVLSPWYQGLAECLAYMGLKEYDEFEILLFSHGRCCRDDLYMEEILD